MFVCSTFLESGMISQMLFLIFSTTTSEEWHQIPIHNPTSSLLGLRSLHRCLLHCRYYGIAQSTQHTYQSGLYVYLLFCSRFNITPTPASSLTLQYYCVDKSQSVSHKTLKIYLAAIRLMHIENDFPDLTTDESLHLRTVQRHMLAI